MDHYIDPRIIDALRAAARRERLEQVCCKPHWLGKWLRELFTLPAPRCC
jgi:hypothetical protein